MTRKEANKELIEMCNYINGNIEIRRKQYEALNMALEALEQPEQKSGKWIYPSDIVGFGRCSECKALWDYSLITNRFFRYCPRCGAKIENSPLKDEKEIEIEE